MRSECINYCFATLVPSSFGTFRMGTVGAQRWAQALCFYTKLPISKSPVSCYFHFLCLLQLLLSLVIAVAYDANIRSF